MDFVSTRQSLEFEPAQATLPQCANISITVDNILEFDETFTVQLNSTEPEVVLLSRDSSIVTISNDDSEHYSDRYDHT